MKLKVLLLLKVLSACFPFVMFLMMTGVVCIEWHGFGVDSTGAVYVGTETEINVYSEGVLVRSVDIDSYRSYYFTIHNDTILLSTAQNRYTIDLAGNILHTENDSDGSTYHELQKLRSIRGEDGADYQAETLFRHTVIKHDGTVIYQMPLMDYSVKLLYQLSTISFIIVVIYELRKGRKRTI